MTSRHNAAETLGENEEMAPERVDALWNRIERKLERAEGVSTSRAAFGRVLVAAAVLLAVGGGVWVGRGVERSSGSEGLAKGFSIETGTEFRTDAEPFAVELADGSKLDVAPRTKMAIARADRAQIELRLGEGTVECEVAKDPNRLFVVNAGGASVRVIGTRFRVARRLTAPGETVEVHVLEGIVEVTRAGQAGAAVEIRAGESWSSTAPAGDGAAIAGTERSAQPPEDLDASRFAGQESRKSRSSVPGPVVDSGARTLFERAGQLRRNGDPRGAAEAYDELVRSSPRDSRAALAAFESARLKMDALGDQGAALRSLERALALAPRASFREDALARLVKLEARLGGGRCAGKRDAYVAEYPNGVHRAEVERVCPR